MSKLKTSIQAKVQTQADKEKAENYFKECDGTSYSLTVHQRTYFKKVTQMGEFVSSELIESDSIPDDENTKFGTLKWKDLKEDASEVFHEAKFSMN